MSTPKQIAHKNICADEKGLHGTPYQLGGAHRTFVANGWNLER